MPMVSLKLMAGAARDMVVDDNPADWPTREDKFHLIPPEAVETPMRIPPSALFGPLNGDSAVLATWQATLNRTQPEARQP